MTRELVKRVNDGAAPGDVVSGHALNERVRQRKEFNNKNRIPENTDTINTETGERF